MLYSMNKIFLNISCSIKFLALSGQIPILDGIQHTHFIFSASTSLIIWGKIIFTISPFFYSLTHSLSCSMKVTTTPLFMWQKHKYAFYMIE